MWTLLLSAAFADPVLDTTHDFDPDDLVVIDIDATDCTEEWRAFLDHVLGRDVSPVEPLEGVAVVHGQDQGFIVYDEALGGHRPQAQQLLTELQERPDGPWSHHQEYQLMPPAKDGELDHLQGSALVYQQLLRDLLDCLEH